MDEQQKKHREDMLKFHEELAALEEETRANNPVVAAYPTYLQNELEELKDERAAQGFNTLGPGGTPTRPVMKDEAEKQKHARDAHANLRRIMEGVNNVLSQDADLDEGLSEEFITTGELAAHAAKRKTQGFHTLGPGGTPSERKATPIASGVLDYFPDAIAEVARVSMAGNEQHHPGKPLHWDKRKSTDEADALMRHFMERGTRDTDGQRHTAKVAWRALALLQRELDAERDAG